MTDEFAAEPVEAPSRKGKIARRVFIGSALLGGAGWWLTGAIQQARREAQRSADK
ncbi:MAG: hypothetical protein H8E37_00540 [Planctomycetes bacterium]|nr:hypothetical protein [Planctomycetota bacterium]